MNDYRQRYEFPDQVCPDCGNVVYAEDGGADRWWWRCETCQYETDIVSPHLVMDSWLFAVKEGRDARYYY